MQLITIQVMKFFNVKKGSIRTILNEETAYDLGEGDIIYYDSEIPHRWENISDVKAELILSTHLQPISGIHANIGMPYWLA